MTTTISETSVSFRTGTKRVAKSRKSMSRTFMSPATNVALYELVSTLSRDANVALYSNSPVSDVYVVCTVTSHFTVNDVYVASTNDVAL
jgi:hypothetical protein